VFHDVLKLDKGDEAHLPEALGAGEEVHLVYLLDKFCPVPEIPFG